MLFTELIGCICGKSPYLCLYPYTHWWKMIRQLCTLTALSTLDDGLENFTVVCNAARLTFFTHYLRKVRKTSA